MKQLIKMSICFFVLITYITIHAQTKGHIASEIELNPGVTTLLPIAYVIDTVLYTPGGVTFTYPVSFFTAKPFVFVHLTESVLIANTVFVPVVMGNSTSGVTVKVYKISDTS